jgi:hypothetical protein
MCREPKPLRQVNSEIPAGLEQICLRCLRKPVGDRYATAGDLADDLRGILADLSSEWSKDSRKRDKESGNSWIERWLRRSFVWLVAGPVILAVVLSGLKIREGRPPPVPVEAVVDMRIWDPEDDSRRGVSVRDAKALPLRPGDQVRLDISLNRPAYIYILWIDSRGKLSPVYPWSCGDWAQTPNAERPVTDLGLPTPIDEAWTIEESPAGMETIVLLARDAPLPNTKNLALVLLDMEPQLSDRISGMLETKNGARVLRRPGGQRAANLEVTAAIDDAVLRNQQRIAKRLGGEFELQYTITFPIRGGRGQHRD